MRHRSNHLIRTGGAFLCLALTLGSFVFAEPSLASDGVVADITVGPLTVFPAFDENTGDYAIRCDTGANDIDFTVDAGSASLITIGGDIVASGESGTVSMVADDLVVVEVTAAGETMSYHYRCLPADFPPYAIDKPGTPGPGYYFTSFGWTRPAEDPASSFVAMLDGDGVPVWYKRTRIRVMDQKLQSDGTLAWLEAGPGPRGYDIYDLDGSLVVHRRTVGHGTDNHDYIELQNGNVMLMSYVTRPCVDLTSLGLSSCATATDGYLQEIDPDTGSLVWEWRSQDHIPVSDRALGAGAGQIPDLVHLNAVDEFPDGDLLVSARSAGVYRIDRTTGAVEWKLGGVASPTRLTMVDDPFDGTWRQHDARVIDADTISVYDNQSGLTRARAVVFDLDEAASTATLVWEKRHGGTLDSRFIGAHRRQPDGHSVITWGGIMPFFEEVDASGDRVFALTLDSEYEYRAVKLQPDEVDIDQLRAEAGGSVEYDTPTDVVATATGETVTVSWNAPAVGSPSAFTVAADPGGATCTTGGALSCVIAGLELGTLYTFSVTADNALGGSLASLPSNEVVLNASLSGRVTNSINGTGIANAAVRLYTSGSSSFVQTTTDGTGAYAFISVPASFYKVQFRAWGFQPLWWDTEPSKWNAPSLLLGPASTAVADQALSRPAGTLSGTVTDAISSAALAGVTVRAYATGSATYVETTTNASGDYSLERPSGYYKLSFSKNGFTPSWYSGKASKWAGDTVLVARGQATDADTALAPIVGTVSGRVTDSSSGSGIPDATVRLWRVGGGMEYQTTSGADGAYTISAVRSAFYKVEFVHLGHATSWYQDASTRYRGSPVLTGGETIVDQQLTAVP